MRNSVKWNGWEALSIFLKTYVEDLTTTRRAVKGAAAAAGISELGASSGLTGLQAGKGQPVVFIHGSPGNAQRWRTYLEHVPAGYWFIAVDRMGFGRRYAQEPDLEADVSLLADFTNALDSPILVGHSLGGAFAARIAATQHVRGLVLVGASLDPDLERIHALQKVARHPVIAALLSSSIRNSNTELFAFHSFLQRTALQLEHILAPIYIVHARNDGLVPVENIKYIERMCANANVRAATPATGAHGIPWSRKDLVLKAINTVAGRQK